LNKYIPYILLFFIPLCTGAQTADTIYEYTEDSIDEVDFTPQKVQGSAAAVATPPEYITRKFDNDFKNKYKDPDFIYKYETVPKSLWQTFLEWLARLFKSDSNKPVNLDWLEVFFKALAFAVIGFVIYLIARSVLDKQGMWIFGRSRKKLRTQEADAENIHEMDFRQLIEETRTAGNYRLALRYYYLWVLKKLSVREIIDWHWDKTNTDYLYEIKDTTLRKDFEYLSYVYDHSWYGDFPVDEKSFTKAEKSFKKTLNTL
jgi:hypothetical protein